MMREVGLSDVRLASPPCFPLSWETDNVSVHLSADYPVIWHQCHSLSQHNTPNAPLVLAWAIYGLSSSPNYQKHCLLSLSSLVVYFHPYTPAVLFCHCERDNFWKAYCIRKKYIINTIITFAFMLNTMYNIISCACVVFISVSSKTHVVVLG